MSPIFRDVPRSESKSQESVIHGQLTNQSINTWAGMRSASQITREQYILPILLILARGPNTRSFS